MTNIKLHIIHLNQILTIIVRNTLLLYLLVITNTEGIGQVYTNIKNLSQKDGLAQASVFAISQDNDGFLWFGTRYGLSKYDGYRFTNYYANEEDDNSVVSDDIRVLYNDSLTEKTWIGTLDGLSQYTSHTDVFVNFTHQPENPRSISSNLIRAIIRDQANQLWVGTDNGLNLYDESSNSWTYVNIGQELESNSINVIIRDTHNKGILVGTQNGLYNVYNQDSKFVIKRLDNGYEWESNHITALTIDQTSNLWIGTFDKGLYKYNFKTKELSHYTTNKISNEKIRVLEVDAKGNVWVGTFYGLNAINIYSDEVKQYYRVFKHEFGLTDNSIRSIFVDNRGSIWVGTYYGGVNHLDESYNQFQNFIYTGENNGISASVISSFAEDVAGNLWVGTEGGGLNYFNKVTGEVEIFKPQKGNPNAIAGNNVKQLLLDYPYLWIGTFNEGLDRLDLRNKKFKHYSQESKNPYGISDNNVYGFLKRGHKLWIITYGGGLNILDLDTDQFQVFRNNPKIINSLSSDYARAILETRDGSIWIGTSKGLNKVVYNDKGLPDQFELYLSKEKIYGLYETQDGMIWIGTTTNGLYKFNPRNKTIQHFTKKEGLSGNTVYGIIEDSEQNLWISTNDGISRMNPQTNQFILYDESNGLNNTEFNYNAFYKTKDGSILFGGTNGFTRFKPKDIKPNTYVPKIVFTSLKQNNEVVPIDPINGILRKALNETNELIFNYGEASFTLEFAALDYFSPENNQFSFKLEGLDNEWNHTVGNASATYTIQKDGKYEFKLKGANSDGIWNEEVRTLSIVVLPPAYKTWWAYLIYFTLLSLGIYSLIRYIKLRNSIKISQIEQLQQENLHQMKLRFFTNIAHEFRTPLTLIIGPLEELLVSSSKDGISDKYKYKLNKIYANAERMLRLVNQLMTFRRIETGNEPLVIRLLDLKELLSSIFNIFEDLAERKNISFSFNAENDKYEAWVDREKIEKVIFNLLSNAFKFTPRDGQISLEIDHDSKSLYIKVKDTGSGVGINLQEQIFQRFYEKNTEASNNLIKGTGIGLSLSRQLAQLHGGSLDVESTEGKGATFTLTLPKGNSHFNKEEIDQSTNLENPYLNTNVIISEYLTHDVQSIEKTVTAEKKILLLVDDNMEILQYMTSIFENDYNILLALDGQEGLQKVQSETPDLIISDVMMPIMDGVSMCRAIKADFNTSHIPILLLTAKSMLDDKLEGLESGATDYISKPFHPEELRLKIKNILYQRQYIGEKLKKEVNFSPQDLHLTTLDDEFLENLIKITEENISNPDFKMEDLAHQLAVSRALLFTKIKSLTEMTPKSFLMSFRFKRAKQLLLTHRLTIAEISYQVGFRDPKYFSKVFQKEFGISPSEFRSEPEPLKESRT